MNEKRFEVDVDHVLLVWDTEKNKRLEIEDIVDLLNEQQSTIERLERKLELKTEEVEYLNRMMVKWGMVKDE